MRICAPFIRRLRREPSRSPIGSSPGAYRLAGDLPRPRCRGRRPPHPAAARSRPFAAVERALLVEPDRHQGDRQLGAHGGGGPAAAPARARAAARRRPLLATLGLVLAAGAKLWPALLLPLILRPLRRSSAPARRSRADHFGRRAAGRADPAGRARRHQRLRRLCAPLADQQRTRAGAAVARRRGPVRAGLTSLDAGLVVRAVLACGLLGLALWLARAPLADAADLMRRCLVLIGRSCCSAPRNTPGTICGSCRCSRCGRSPGCLS